MSLASVLGGSNLYLNPDGSIGPVSQPSPGSYTSPHGTISIDPSQLGQSIIPSAYALSPGQSANLAPTGSNGYVNVPGGTPLVQGGQTPNLVGSGANAGAPAAAPAPGGGAGSSVLGSGVAPSVPTGPTAAQQSLLDALEQDYHSQVGQLDQAQTDTQTGATQALNNLNSGNDFINGQVNTLKTNDLNNLNAGAANTNLQADSALAEAKRQFQLLQQGNNAFLSAGGISSSSTADQMQQQLGQNTLAGVNAIQQNRDSYLKAIDTEKTRLTSYLGDQQNSLQSAYKDAVDQVNTELTAALGRINDSRTMADNQKATARDAILKNAQGVLNQVQLQAADYNTAIANFNNKQSQTLYNLSRFALSVPNSVDFNNALNNLASSGYDVQKFLSDQAAGKPQSFGAYFLGRPAGQGTTPATVFSQSYPTANGPSTQPQVSVGA